MQSVEDVGHAPGCSVFQHRETGQRLRASLVKAVRKFRIGAKTKDNECLLYLYGRNQGGTADYIRPLHLATGVRDLSF